MSHAKLRVGLIGAGGIATGAHIPGYKAVSEQVELVAIADVDAKRAAAVASEHGFAHHFGDYRQMLSEVELDAVSVCTPNKFHAPASLAALEAGCHVICEKPPGMNAVEVSQMIEAAEKADRIITFGLNNRFSEEMQAARRFVDGGELGPIYAAAVSAMRRRGIPGWGVFTNKELQGGGPLIDIGVHVLDQALWLMDYPMPVQALASTYQHLGSRPGVGTMGQWDWQNFSVEDLAMGAVRFENGATLTIETSFAVNGPDNHGFRLMGIEGGLSLSPLKFYKEVHGTLVDITPAWLPRQGGTHTVQMKHFVNACLTGGEPMVKPHEALRLQLVLDALYASADAQAPVEIRPGE